MFIHMITGFAVAAMLAILGVPQIVLLALQIALVIAAGAVLIAQRRRMRR